MKYTNIDVDIETTAKRERIQTDKSTHDKDRILWDNCREFET